MMEEVKIEFFSARHARSLFSLLLPLAFLLTSPRRWGNNGLMRTTGRSFAASSI
jgi:hypothetical protein